jgi:hypothetical protein
MKKIKLLFKNHWQLLVIEAVIVLIYGLASYYIDKNPVGNFTMLSIIFSNEFFVAMIVGIAAVYSWVHHKKISDSEIEDSHYDNKLQLLRNVDELLEVYKNKGEVREIGIEIEDFLISLENQYIQKQEVLKPRDEFLNIYYRFIREKISTDQDSLEGEESDFESQEKSSNISSNSSGASGIKNEDEQENPIQVVKTKVSRKLGVPMKNIRFSKNYEDDAIKDELEWTTWYTIGKNVIDKLQDKEKLIFITKAHNKDIIFQIQGKDLKDIISEGKPRKRRRAGKEVYDLFFGQDSDGTFVEGRHKIDLQKYNIKRL